MKGPRLRAVVLTAGFGYRLRPLTQFLPKALLPVCGETVAGRTLRQLTLVNTEAAALNTHHLAGAISGYFGERYEQLPIIYSPEREIQGTLGALYPLKSFLAEAEHIVVLNGDTLCQWPLKAMIRSHIRSDADATMLLHRREPEELLGGPVGVDSRGTVVQLRDSTPIGEITRRHLFAGAHILSRNLLDRIEEGPGDIVGDLYIPLLRQHGRIQSVVTGRRWHDLGTPRRYLEASLDWAGHHKKLAGFGSRSFISPEATVSQAAVIQRSVVEARVEVEEDVRVEDSILLPGSHVPKASLIRHSIIGPDVELPSAANIERHLVTRILSGYALRTRDSLMGDLVYSPLR